MKQFALSLGFAVVFCAFSGSANAAALTNAQISQLITDETTVLNYLHAFNNDVSKQDNSAIVADMNNATNAETAVHTDMVNDGLPSIIQNTQILEFSELDQLYGTLLYRNEPTKEPAFLNLGSISFQLNTVANTLIGLNNELAAIPALQVALQPILVNQIGAVMTSSGQVGVAGSLID